MNVSSQIPQKKSPTRGTLTNQKRYSPTIIFLLWFPLSPLFVSSNPKKYVGLQYISSCIFQVEMTGSSIFDYVHVADHSELAEQLGLCLPQSGGSGGSAMPSPASTSDDGSSSAPTPRAQSPPLPDRGEWPYSTLHREPNAFLFRICLWIMTTVCLNERSWSWKRQEVLQ